MDAENDNEKVNMPLFPSPKPNVNCFNDLDFFKDFENECPAIVYNDVVEGYTEEIVHEFKQRLEMIFGRQVNRVHTLDYEGLTPNMRQDLAERLRMVYTRDDGQDICVSHAWRSWEELDVLESERVILDKGDLSGYWIEISSDKDFLRSAPSYTYIRYPFQRQYHSMDQGAANVSYLLAQYLFRHAEGRKSGLSVVARELPLIDMCELVKLNICTEVGDDWSWVAQGVERQPIAMAAAPRDAEDAPDVDKGAMFQHPYMHPHHHHQLQVGLCPRDWGDLRRRYRGYVRMSGVYKDLWRDR
ncbi:hypothetical protein Tco_0602369 [Tanacetum coccineum]